MSNDMPRWARVGLLVAVTVAVAGVLFYALRTPDRSVRHAVHLRLPSFALNLHPLKNVDVESRRVATLLYAGLVAQDQDGNTHPFLAKRWNKSGDEWEFVLRTGMTFSNGQPVTSQDIATSLCAAMQPTSPWAWALASIEHEARPGGNVECTGLRAESSEVVKIKEKKPVAWLLDALSGPAGWIIPAFNAKEMTYGLMPGAGPYRVKEIVPDVKVVLEARREGSPIEPGVEVVQFDYLPDDAVAVGQFAAGKLDVLDLVSPQLIELVTERGSRTLKYPGTLVQTSWDRIRVVIINEKALATKGFDSDQTRAFIDAFSDAVDREKIAGLSRGSGEPLETPFLHDTGAVFSGPVRKVPPIFPSAQLMILTEPDPYSDLIAASLPKKVGKVSLDYKGVKKGILIDSLIKGQYDLVSVLVEAPVHSPDFWKSFFAPGSPHSVFGKPIPGLDTLDVSTSSGIAETAGRIKESGNWIAIMKERHLLAVAPEVDGIVFTPSGHINYAFIKKR